MGQIPGVDLDRLTAWLDERGHESGPLRDIEQLGGGTQNILVRFRRENCIYVLRRGPLHKRASSDETMRREARVLRALNGSDIPHPRLVDDCPDASVLGSAFYLMESVDGVNPRAGLPGSYRDDVAARREVGLAFVDAAAAIASFGHAAAGLDGLGRPSGFLERQVARWRSAYDAYDASPHYDGRVRRREIDAVGAWLEQHRPKSFRPGLQHGDYHLGNIMVDRARPRVAAVVDWELATIGDPLLDLGWILATWPDPDAPAFGTIGFEPWDGMLTETEVLARYASNTRQDLTRIGWYATLAAFKLGIILEGTYVRSLDGEASAEVGLEMHQHSIALFTRAQKRIGGMSWPRRPESN
jgi:aminoglycoside phosphotransferase (APT) family kinase protein